MAGWTSAAWLALWALALVAPAWAADDDAAPPAAPGPESRPPDQEPQPLLEATRRSARSAAEWLAREVDGWFGDRPFEDGGQVSNGRLNLGVYKRQDQSTDVDFRFNATFRLPNVQQHAYLFVGRDDEREVVRDTPETLLNQQQALGGQRTDPSFLAGLGLSLRNSIGFRVGLRSRAKPYAQARYAPSWTVAPGHVVDFRETLFWSQDDRFGSTTALAYDFAVSPALALRWLTVATVTQASRNLEWSSILGAYRSLDGQCLLSFELHLTGEGQKGTGVGRSDRGVLAKWEQPVYKDWLFVEAVAGHFWPRPDAASARGRAWALGSSLKLRF